jgi:hypothetical protein
LRRQARLWHAMMLTAARHQRHCRYRSRTGREPR